MATDPATVDIPIVILSAEALPSDVDGLPRGATAYPTKPFRMEVILEFTEELLGGRS